MARITIKLSLILTPLNGILLFPWNLGEVIYLSNDIFYCQEEFFRERTIRFEIRSTFPDFRASFSSKISLIFHFDESSLILSDNENFRFMY